MSYFYPHKLPTEGDLVFVRVLKIEPAYSLVELIEYNNCHGMIVHVQLSGKRIYGNLSKFIQVNQKMVLEVMKVEGTNIDLTNRNTSDKKEFMATYRQANAIHLTCQYIASKIGWDFTKFLETIVYPLYTEEQTAYKSLLDPEFRNQWLFEKIPDHAQFCLDNLNKLFSTKKIKPAPILLSLICYAPDGVERLRKFGFDTELSLENEGICVRFERIGDKYSLSIADTELEEIVYTTIREKILSVLDHTIINTEIEMNII